MYEDQVNLYELLIFINDTVDEDSIVLFFDTSYWQYAVSLLYPRIICTLLEYTDDEDLFEYLRVYHTDYILIAEEQNHLSSYTNLFIKIEFDDLNYLLEVEQSAL
jgi:hypothetical protein